MNKNLHFTESQLIIDLDQKCSISSSTVLPSDSHYLRIKEICDVIKPRKGIITGNILYKTGTTDLECYKRILHATKLYSNKTRCQTWLYSQHTNNLRDMKNKLGSKGQVGKKAAMVKGLLTALRELHANYLQNTCVDDRDMNYDEEEKVMIKPLRNEQEEHKYQWLLTGRLSIGYRNKPIWRGSSALISQMFKTMDMDNTYNTHDTYPNREYMKRVMTIKNNEPVGYVFLSDALGRPVWEYSIKDEEPKLYSWISYNKRALKKFDAKFSDINEEWKRNSLRLLQQKGYDTDCFKKP